MSLITFKDGTMVGDKRYFLGDLYTDGRAVKAHEFNGYLFGTTGLESKSREVINWFCEGKEDPYPDPGGEAAVLVYDGETLIRYCGSYEHVMYRTDEPFADGPDMAVGIALGAMHAGMSAEEANLLAQRLTIVCGGGVDVVTLEDRPSQGQRDAFREYTNSGGRSCGCGVDVVTLEDRPSQKQRDAFREFAAPQGCSCGCGEE